MTQGPLLRLGVPLEGDVPIEDAQSVARTAVHAAAAPGASVCNQDSSHSFPSPGGPMRA